MEIPPMSDGVDRMKMAEEVLTGNKILKTKGSRMEGRILGYLTTLLKFKKSYGIG
jgi:hypothetical protein